MVRSFFKFFFPTTYARWTTGTGIVLEQTASFHIDDDGNEVVTYEIHNFRTLLKLRLPLLKFWRLGGVLKNPDYWMLDFQRGAVGFVQAPAGGSNPGSVTTANLAFGANVTSGGFISVYLRYGANGRTVTITDTKNNTYYFDRLHVQANDGSGELRLHHAESIQGGADTVTVLVSGAASTMRFIISEFSGVAAKNALDQVNSAEGGPSVNVNSGSITPTTDGQLLICGAEKVNVGTFTAGTDFTMITTVVAAAGSHRIAAEYYVQPVAAAHAGTMTLEVGGDSWAAVVASYKPRLPAPPFVTNKLRPRSFVPGLAH